MTMDETERETQNNGRCWSLQQFKVMNTFDEINSNSKWNCVEIPMKIKALEMACNWGEEENRISFLFVAYCIIRHRLLGLVNASGKQTNRQNELIWAGVQSTRSSTNGKLSKIAEYNRTFSHGNRLCDLVCSNSSTFYFTPIPFFFESCSAIFTR